jgi:antitoxin component YwqK of YwqJK toxin-antitoxin module
MKHHLTLLLGLLSFSLFAQNKLVIGKSDSIIYAPSYSEESIDSVVILAYRGTPLFCDAYEVYFDSNFTALAFESQTSDGDTCRTIDYWRNGNIKNVNLFVENSDGQPVLYCEEMYCSNGYLIRKFYPNHEGRVLVTNYHCNGVKKNEFYHLGFGIDGKMSSWFDNGNQEFEIFFTNNSKSGTWRFWTVDGKLSKKEKYEDGVLVK